jgi:hypothetical protein
VSDFSWSRVIIEAAFGVVIYYPIHALASRMLFNPGHEPMRIWPLSDWLEFGPSPGEMLFVGVLIFIGAGMLRAQRKNLFDE